jgi:hypothetical protein
MYSLNQEVYSNILIYLSREFMTNNSRGFEAPEIAPSRLMSNVGAGRTAAQPTKEAHPIEPQCAYKSFDENNFNNNGRGDNDNLDRTQK